LDTSPNDEEGSDDNEDSDMEAGSSDEEESEGSLSDTSSSLSDPNDDDDLVLRSSLKEALGEFNANSSDDDSEEELLDDDAMLALDEKISAAFKMQHQSRGGGKGEIFILSLEGIVDFVLKRKWNARHCISGIEFWISSTHF
jgi:hypothetical protein